MKSSRCYLLAAPGVPVPTCFFNFVLSKFYANVSCHQKIIKPKQVLSLARVSIHSQAARGVSCPTLLVGSNYLLDLTQRNACHQSNKNPREAAAKVSIPSRPPEASPAPLSVAAAARLPMGTAPIHGFIISAPFISLLRPVSPWTNASFQWQKNY